MTGVIILSEILQSRPSKARIWFWELRLPFATASIVPILLGTTIAWALTGILLWDVFLLTLIGGVCVHLGANVANDYWDYRNGTDNINVEFIRPFTGGSRMIQKGLLSPREVITGSMILLSFASIIGLYLMAIRGLLVLILGLLGIFFGFFYSSPPIKFVSRGVGEIIIGICFGIFLTLGAFYTQSQFFAWEPVIVALPISFLISLVLYINEFADYNADKAAGKYTLVVRLGRKRASQLYAIILVFCYLIPSIAVLMKITNWYTLIAFSTLPLSILGAYYALSAYDRPIEMIPANVSTILNHLLTGITLLLAYLFLGLSFLFTPMVILPFVVLTGIIGSIGTTLFALRLHKQSQARQKGH